MAKEFRINGNKYNCVFKIGDQKNTGSPFSKYAIRSLDLEENLFEPFQNATITFNNPLELIEDRQLTRGDGRDYFSFMIQDQSCSDCTPLKYDFCIIGEHNSTSTSDRTNNFKTYSLVDKNYQILNEPIPYGKRYRGKIGDILKKIFEEHGIGIGNPWEPGDHFVNIFPEHVLAPVSFRYSDLVKYLLRINYNKAGETYTRSLLYYDRYQGAFVLNPMDNLFQTAKCYENFIAGDLADGSPNENNSSLGCCGKTTRSSLMYNSDLTTPMAAYSNEFFMNFIASGYDPDIGEHGLREIRIEDIKPKWEALFRSKCSSGGTPFLPLNKVKKQEQFRTFSFPLELDKAAKLAEAEMISNLTFYNLELAINNLGDTGRMAGQYVNIVKPGKAVNSDAKLLGQWMVTKARHQFINDEYYTTLQLCKTSIGPGNPTSESGGVENVNQDCMEGIPSESVQ